MTGNGDGWAPAAADGATWTRHHPVCSYRLWLEKGMRGELTEDDGDGFPPCDCSASLVDVDVDNDIEAEIAAVQSENAATLERLALRGLTIPPMAVDALRLATWLRTLLNHFGLTEQANLDFQLALRSQLEDAEAGADVQKLVTP